METGLIVDPIILVNGGFIDNVIHESIIRKAEIKHSEHMLKLQLIHTGLTDVMKAIIGAVKKGLGDSSRIDPIQLFTHLMETDETMFCQIHYHVETRINTHMGYTSELYQLRELPNNTIGVLRARELAIVAPYEFQRHKPQTVIPTFEDTLIDLYLECKQINELFS